MVKMLTIIIGIVLTSIGKLVQASTIPSGLTTVDKWSDNARKIQKSLTAENMTELDRFIKYMEGYNWALLKLIFNATTGLKMKETPEQTATEPNDSVNTDLNLNKLSSSEQHGMTASGRRNLQMLLTSGNTAEQETFIEHMGKHRELLKLIFNDSSGLKMEKTPEGKDDTINTDLNLDKQENISEESSSQNPEDAKTNQSNV